MEEKTQRSVLLDIIRTLAIAIIVFYHILVVNLKSPLANIHFGISPFYWKTWGEVGVTIFLILSGIVLELNYGKRKLKYLSFIYNRILRIYPVYYLAVLITIFTACIQYGHFKYTLNLSDLFYTLTGFYAFAGKWGGPFIVTSWFIGLIMALYFLYPLISKSMKKWPHATILMLLVISAMSISTLNHFPILPKWPQNWFPLCRVFEFGLGVYIANRIKTHFWGHLNNSKTVARIFKFTSEISFPLFLIHYPFLDLLPYFVKFMNLYLAIALYLCISIIVSYVMLILIQSVKHYYFRTTKAKGSLA
jgi:peptidoglycan/LPS O-acetylase OafA/YrhL